MITRINLLETAAVRWHASSIAPQRTRASLLARRRPPRKCTAHNSCWIRIRKHHAAKCRARLLPPAQVRDVMHDPNNSVCRIRKGTHIMPCQHIEMAKPRWERTVVYCINSSREIGNKRYDSPTRDGYGPLDISHIGASKYLAYRTLGCMHQVNMVVTGFPYSKPGGNQRQQDNSTNRVQINGVERRRCITSRTDRHHHLSGFCVILKRHHKAGSALDYGGCRSTCSRVDPVQRDGRLRRCRLLNDVEKEKPDECRFEHGTVARASQHVRQHAAALPAAASHRLFELFPRNYGACRETWRNSATKTLLHIIMADGGKA